MGFFDKNKQDDKQKAPVSPVPKSPMPSPGGKTSTIAEGAVCEGVTRAENDIYISGIVRGELHCKAQIVVEQSGLVEAQVSCQSIVVKGAVKGDVKADDHVTIAASGKLTGDITAKVFTNQPGGFFEGYSHMMQDDPARPKGGAPDSKTTEESGKPKKK